MSSSPFALDDDFHGNGESLKRPPKILLILSLLSVTLGLLVGVYGVITAATASNSEEYSLGLAGYFLTALLPIVLLQISRSRHSSALAVNQEEPYDSYAGQQMESKFLKVVFVGLISAGLSIYVFFLPIAEKFAA